MLLLSASILSEGEVIYLCFRYGSGVIKAINPSGFDLKPLGYPYECASAGEVIKFCEREFGFILKNLKTVNDLGVNEFVFVNPVKKA